MCNLFKNHLPLLLAILKLFTETYGENNISNISLHNLTVICGITDGKSEIKTIPPQCTAIAEYTNNLERLQLVFSMKGDLQFMIIIDTVDFNKKEDLDNLDNFLKTLKVDFLVFDLHKLAEYNGDGGPDQFIHQYVKTMRDKVKGTGIGFLIHNDAPSLEKKIDCGAYNDIADFFLLQSTGYIDCEYNDFQGAMQELATRDNIANSIQYLKDHKLDISKLIFTIELKIESEFRLSSEEMGYSYLCSHKLSKDRRYCFQTEVCLFDKARLRTDFNVLGVFIMGIEYDDVDGTCGCTTESDKDPKFRGLKTVAGASQENVNTYEFYECTNGQYPIILS